MLEGRNLLITGVVNEHSIAYATARTAQQWGANVVLTAPPRDREPASAAARELGTELVDLDVTDPAQFDELAAHLRSGVGHLHGVLHAVAWAPAEALAGPLASQSAERLGRSFDTSVTSYARCAALLADLAPPPGSPDAAGVSLVGLTFDASRAWAIYNWMGAMKAALEAINRSVARQFGPAGLRSNMVAAGPLHTRAAGGIPGFEVLLESWESAPLGWDPTDAYPVADVICFLFSDLARQVTGQMISVDGGHSAVQGGEPGGGSGGEPGGDHG
jgi:enoyl-[acyl-carrier protein] reductase I